MSNVQARNVKAELGQLSFRAMDLNLDLTRSPQELGDSLRSLRDRKDVADLLEVPLKSLNYWIYATSEDKRYSTFSIPKRHGGFRQIEAPNKNIKILQQKLNLVLQAVHRPRPSAHGFAIGKSVKTNAQEHVGKRWVFNLDLEDFFHTIHFGRVRGLFMGSRYNLPEEVATVLAQLCCHQAHLAQGAPTSPIISNMICSGMDGQLQKLARDCASWYTRYADDMTFSTKRKSFPSDLATPNGLGQVEVGQRLREIIERNGFLINERKVRLRGSNQRQDVTGVVVNDITNVPKRFENQIRAMLFVWKKHGLTAAQETWQQKHDHKHRRPGSRVPGFEQVLKGKIEYLGMIKGQDSLTYLRFIDQLGELEPNLTGGRGTPLRLLLQKYMQLHDNPESHQTRGYQLEQIINDLFTTSGLDVVDGFTRNSGAEQIDGAFRLEGWHYLVECKWTTAVTSVKELDSLSGKLDRSGFQSAGLLISVNGWSKHAEPSLKQNPKKNIMLMHGKDLQAALEGNIDLVDLLRAKISALSVRADPFLGADEIAQPAK